MSFNILIVDDSETTRQMIAKTLRLAKVPINKLLEACNGQEGLDILEQEWVDLVLADLNMPVMTGMEMLERMAEDGVLKTIPVVIVSTEGSTTRIDQLKAKGISAYVRKPFTPELIGKIARDLLMGEADE